MGGRESGRLFVDIGARAQVRGEKPILLGTRQRKQLSWGRRRKIGGRCKRLYPEREFDYLRTTSEGQRRWVFFSLQFCVTNDKVVPREKMKELTLGNIVKARITRRRG